VKDVLLSNSNEIDKLTIPIKGSYDFGRYEGVGSVIELDYDENVQALKEFLNGKSSREVTE
jgi:polyisoprenyl-teichoic acid--peptidoglycan teichoic acid transferase